ncbi:MarR family transcriptional regulator [Paenibacillus sp. MWE-103]|uniref:MarR family transcriptional regulator n=1 Tax=Paenibacillus artemisiicola TaxID=1172618 RepID=A0ABS3WCV7_9BACL|nr:MarR family transcriptional regulator [Paenibacillus artemisiicola]MBO7746138.1 MarR family transcriptional regulator [Paenibacillus artemisiicola]
MSELWKYVTEQPLETQAFFALVETTAELVAVSEKYWASNGMNGARMRMLVEIAKAGGAILPSELASRIGVTKANVSVLLLPLEQSGYIRSSSHPEDGRKRRIELSPEGERVLRELLPGNRAAVAEGMRRLDEAEMRQLLGLLRKLRQDGP